MIPRVILCLLAAAPIRAELTLSVVRDGAEIQIPSQVQLASAAVGDRLDTLFRVRNAGKANAPVTVLSIAGVAFSLTNLPDLPATLAPGASVDFTVRFQPTLAASYSALLKTDGAQIFVLANAVPVARVYVDANGSRRPIDTVAGLDFGALERGGQATRRLVLVNESGQQLTTALGVIGGAWQLAPGSPAAIVLDPLKSANVDVLYQPATAGAQLGELQIDARRFPLRGTTIEPPLPKPVVTLDFGDTPPASGRQAVASVRFDPAPRTSGAGRLRIDFHPSVAAADDPAIVFLTTASRAIDFSVIEGEVNAQFGPAVTIPLQTGTTAGTIVLTAELGDYTETATVEIPPQPVVIDTVQMTRTASGVDLQVSGYDNTRSLTGAQFTFLGPDGQPLAPGAIQQDLASAFKDYFASSTLGGSFQLKLSFPVTGGTASIDSVRVVLTNQAGQTSWPK